MNTIRIAALLACAAAIGTPLALRAQTQPPAQTATDSAAVGVPEHHGNFLLNALQSLTLSPAQHQKINGFVAASQQADAGATVDQRRADRKKLRENIMSVLTPAQQAQLKATLAKERAQREAEMNSGS